MEILVGVMFVLTAGAAGIAVCLVKRAVQLKRERVRLHEQVSNAIAKITADGRVEGPKGKFKWRHWAGKWVKYANSLPPPRAQSQRFPQFKEMPPYPKREQ